MSNEFLYNMYQQQFTNNMFANNTIFTANLLQGSAGSTLPAMQPQLNTDTLQLTTPIISKKEEKSDSTVKNVAIAGGLITGALVAADFIFAKGRHVKSLFKGLKNSTDDVVKGSDDVAKKGSEAVKNGVDDVSKKLAGEEASQFAKISDDLTKLDAPIPYRYGEAFPAEDMLDDYFKLYNVKSRGNLVSSLDNIQHNVDLQRVAYLEKTFDRSTITMDNFIQKLEGYNSVNFFNQIPLKAPNNAGGRSSSKSIVLELLGREELEVLTFGDMHKLIEMNTKSGVKVRGLEEIYLGKIQTGIKNGTVDQQHFESYIGNFHDELKHVKELLEVRGSLNKY